MPESLYEKINTTLTWRRVVVVNIVLLIIVGFVSSLWLLNVNTEIRSKAAVMAPTPTPYSPPNYPGDLPAIDRVTPFFGKTGDAIVISGAHFGNHPWESKVFVGTIETSREDITSWTDSLIIAVIPSGAQSGNVWVSINGKQAVWEGILSVSDSVHAAQIALDRISASKTHVYLTGAANATRGIIEISNIVDKSAFTASQDVSVISQEIKANTDNNTLTLSVTFSNPLSGEKFLLGDIHDVIISCAQITRSELYDQLDNIIPMFENPSYEINPK